MEGQLVGTRAFVAGIRDPMAQLWGKTKTALQQRNLENFANFFAGLLDAGIQYTGSFSLFLAGLCWGAIGITGDRNLFKSMAENMSPMADVRTRRQVGSIVLALTTPAGLAFLNKAILLADAFRK